MTKLPIKRHFCPSILKNNATFANQLTNTQQHTNTRSRHQCKFIKWEPSGSRKVLSGGLKHGIIFLYKKEKSAKYLCETTYKKTSEYKGELRFQLKEKLKNHQNQVIKKMNFAFDDSCHLHNFALGTWYQKDCFIVCLHVSHLGGYGQVGFKVPMTISEFASCVSSTREQSHAKSRNNCIKRGAISSTAIILLKTAAKMCTSQMMIPA